MSGTHILSHIYIPIKVHRKPKTANVSILVKEETKVQRLRWGDLNEYSGLLAYDYYIKSLRRKLKNLKVR